MSEGGASDPDPDVVARLVAAGCVAAREEAAELTAAAPNVDTLEAWIRRREQGEPLAWITGRVRFAGLRLRVAEGVYVPRPHTGELAHRAADALPAGGRALDVCTGTGAIAAFLVAHVAQARVVGTDRDPRAAGCARSNGVAVVGCDLADAIGGDGAWDVVTAVAPYVPTEDLRLLPSDVRAYEPRAALDGGVDGLDHVRGVVAAADRLLRPGGHLLVEIGGDQAEALGLAAADHGFDTVETWHDDDGDLRGLMARQRYSARSRYVMATHPGTTGIQNVARR